MGLSLLDELPPKQALDFLSTARINVHPMLSGAVESIGHQIRCNYSKSKEIEKISSVLRAQGEPDYIEDITSVSNSSEDDGNIPAGETDELYNEAINIVKSEGKASTSFLQRKLQIGYNRAARIIDMMEEKGVVSKANHVGKREVL